MKKLLCLLLCALLVLSATSVMAWVDPATGIDFGNASPDGGAGEEKIGNEFASDGKIERSVDIDYRIWAKGVFISPDVPAIIVDGEESKSEYFSSIVGGTVLAPLRAVLDAAGSPIDWDEKTRSALVTLKNGDILRLSVDTGAVDGKKSYRVETKESRTMVELSFFELIEGLKIDDDYTRKILIITTDKYEYGDVVPLNFGEKIYKDVLKGEYEGQIREFPYALNGAMAIPDNDKSPVVIFMHGSHGGDSATSRVDLGFSYQMRELVKNGYAAFSFNFNIIHNFDNGAGNTEIWEPVLIGEYISRLKAANEGKNTEFPLSLTNKLDLDKVILVGHSRGGGNVLMSTGIYEKEGAKIVGISAYGPIDLSRTADKIPDLPLSIVCGELDGDVSELWGAGMYSELSVIDERKSDIHLVYLYGGNHNAFNQALTRQDNNGKDMSPSWGDQVKPKNIMPPEKQRDLYAKYLLDFVKAVSAGADLSVLPNNLNGDFYGEKAMFSYSPGKAKRLLSAETDTLAPIGGAEITNVTANLNRAKRTLPRFMDIPLIGFYDLKLFRVAWTQEGAGASIDLANEKSDFTDYRNLTLTLAQDSPDELNGGKNQSVNIILTDKDNKTFKYELKEPAALWWQDGAVVTLKDDGTDKVEQMYVGHTPLMSINLPLSEVNGIDIASIKNIALEFPKNSGCVVIRTITLGK